jgi:hypothetical protein
MAGATTFFKKGASVSDQCSASVTLSGVYDVDWWSGSISVKRDELAARAGSVINCSSVEILLISYHLIGENTRSSTIAASPRYDIHT